MHYGHEEEPPVCKPFAGMPPLHRDEDPLHGV
jgi:hypothetical protein